MDEVVTVLLGVLAGEALRRLVAGGRYRRPTDTRPARRLLWGAPAGGAGALVVVRALDGRPALVVVAALAAAGVLLTLALVDADVHRLPDVLTRPLAGGLVCADGVASLLLHSPGPLVAGACAGIGLFAAFVVLALVGSGLGYGDVKLAGAVGIGLGPFGVGAVVAFPVIGFVLGGLVALVLLGTGRAERTSHLALGPGLAAGAVLALAFA